MNIATCAEFFVHPLNINTLILRVYMMFRPKYTNTHDFCVNILRQIFQLFICTSSLQLRHTSVMVHEIAGNSAVYSTACLR